MRLYMVEELDDLLDLPLPGEEAGDESELPQTMQPPPRRRSRGRGPWIAVGILAAGVVGYFLPRPGPPVLGSLQVLLDFEQQRVGETAPERAIELRNEGERLLRLSEIRLEGTDAADVEAWRAEGMRPASYTACSATKSKGSKWAGAITRFCWTYTAIYWLTCKSSEPVIQVF